MVLVPVTMMVVDNTSHIKVGVLVTAIVLVVEIVTETLIA